MLAWRGGMGFTKKSRHEAKNEQSDRSRCLRSLVDSALAEQRF